MKTLSSIIILLTTLCVSTQAQTNAFEAFYPETNLQKGMCIRQTADGGYIIGASVSYMDSNHRLESRPVFIKTDVSGQNSWSTGFCRNYTPTSIAQTADGGFISLGKMGATGHVSVQPAALVQLNSLGDTVWSKTLTGITLAGSPLSSEALCVSSDNGFVMTGQMNSATYGVHIYKTNSNGDSVWQKTIGGNYNMSGYSIQNTNDGGYIVAGSDSAHILLTKVNANGDSVWMKSLGAVGFIEKGMSVKQTADGGFVVIGKCDASAGNWHIFKTDASGNSQWDKSFSGASNPFFNGVVCQTNDHGYVVLGDNGNNPVMIKLDSTGTLSWGKNYNQNASTTSIFSGLVTSDNGLLVCGYNYQYNSGNTGIYVKKTNDNGNWTNAILGNLFVDKNHNCSQDAGEIGLANRQVVLNPGFVVTNTDSLGNYSFNVPAGTYTVTLPDAEYYGLSCPSVNGYTLSFPSLGDTASNKNFADTTQTSCPDLTISTNTCGFGACFKNTYYVNYSNQGTVADSNVVITMTVDSNIIFLSSSTLWNATGAHTYTFNIGSLQPGQSGSINILDSVSCSAPMGVNACVSAHIAGSISECDTTDNLSTDCHTINSSMDPNERQVKSQEFHTNGYVTAETIQAKDRLSFLVTFQNTGTAPAMNVTVTDSLSSLLDLSTLEPISASAPYSYSVNSNGLVVWHLNNIMLADSGHNKAGSVGFIRYRISQKAGNPGGSVIRTRSSVVFDANKPVLTNATVNTIMLVTGEAPVAVQVPSATRIYPNPSNGSTNIEINTEGINAGSEIRCSVYDAVGKELSSVIIPAGAYNATQANTLVYPMELSSLGAGMYFYSVRNGNNMIGSGKMVIR
ncbi:MAG TPA: T9SS type A sorting domain-containing protein [Bacteroidia bacterium]|nr:T9SS type A sorting domain-containing protein [Bacteroidia bacterium]